jgi:hypothetical protein
MHAKVVSVDVLQKIKIKLKNLEELKKFEFDLSEYGEDLNFKASEVEKFIKDLLGGSLYECERRLNEANDLLAKLLKRDIELNNGINDFEQEMKQALATSSSPSLTDLSRKFQTEDMQDKKALKGIDTDAGKIKQMLQKI